MKGQAFGVMLLPHPCLAASQVGTGPRGRTREKPKWFCP
jgi:hypothetical protein